MPQDYKFILKASALLCKEAEKYLNDKIDEAYLPLRVSQIDRFLVDGRRQIRLWKKDVAAYELEVKKLEKQKNLLNANSSKKEGALAQIQKLLDSQIEGEKSAADCILNLGTLLDSLEDRVQELRQTCLSSSYEAKSRLKVSDIIAEE